METVTSILSAMTSIAPTTGTIQAVLFFAVLALDVIVGVASMIAGIVGGNAPRRLGYASSMGASFGGLVWIAAAIPHAMIIGVIAGIIPAMFSRT